MGITVQDSVVIGKPAAQVFAFVADHENLPAWTVGVKSARRLTDGPPGAGARYEVTGQIMGRQIASTYEVTGYRDGSGFDGTMRSPAFGFRERYSFDADGGCTVVTMTAQVEPRGIFTILRPILAAAVRRQVSADHRRLKAVLEAT